MSKLRKEFSEAAWKDCCGKFCDDCKIAESYKDKYGKKEAQKKLKKDKKKPT